MSISTIEQLLFRAQKREELRFVEWLVFEEGEETLGDAEAEGGGHAVFHGFDVVAVKALGFVVAGVA